MMPAGHVHLMGIGGIHMSAIAVLLRGQGWRVSGCDLYPSRLTQRLQGMGIAVLTGHDPCHLEGVDMLVHTAAVRPDNPELTAARATGMPVLKRAEMVARLAQGKRVVAVAGCHGKTTTTSLVAYILWRAGLRPTFLLGGEMVGLETNVMAGDGPHFSRGWDWPSLAADEGLDWGGLSRAFEPLAQLPRPVVCAIGGECISAGLELALACDVRICSDDARFALPETGLGLIPLAGGIQRLARTVGRAWATYMVLTGQEIGAQEALALGLVSRVVPRARLLEEADAICQRIAQRGPLAVRYAKEAVQRGCEMPLEQALRYETDLTIILQTTQDRAEGVRAFLEKRPPRFTGT